MQRSAKARYTLLGMLLMFVISYAIVPAIGAVTYKQINVLYDDIKVIANGKLIDQSAAGIPINPFMLGGITYIPARAVGEALCDGVTSWDESTKTLYLGPRPAPSAVTIKGVEYSTDSTVLSFTVTPKTNLSEILTDADTEPLKYFTKLEV